MVPSAMVTAIIAAVDGTTTVIAIPTRTVATRRMRPSPPSLDSESKTTGSVRSDANPVSSQWRPTNRRPRPRTSSPSDRNRSRCAKIASSAPMPSRTSGRRCRRSARSQPVTVAPTFAPSVTLAACHSAISPALTKLTTITVVTDDDWLSALTTTPAPKPRNRSLPTRPMMRRRRSPARACAASDMVLSPSRRRPKPPGMSNHGFIAAIDPHACKRKSTFIRPMRPIGPMGPIGRLPALGAAQHPAADAERAQVAERRADAAVQHHRHRQLPVGIAPRRRSRRSRSGRRRAAACRAWWRRGDSRGASASGTARPGRRAASVPRWRAPASRRRAAACR